MINLKIRNWVKRFLPAEIICVITAVGCAKIIKLFTSNNLTIGYAGTVGEAIGFYSTIFVQNYLSEGRKVTIKNEKIYKIGFFKIVLNIIQEFGPAALIDGVLLRPFFMYLFPLILNNLTLGIIVGKLLGDISFYALIIVFSQIKERNYKQKKF